MMYRYEKDRAMHKGGHTVSVFNKMIGLMVIALFISGCAAKQKELLVQDYLRMTNDEVLTYYCQLSDEIDRCVSESNKVSVGLGTGFGIGGVGIGMGVSESAPTCKADELRQRRSAVRIELQHRGVNP
jgi:hypothetical protein